MALRAPQHASGGDDIVSRLARARRLFEWMNKLIKWQSPHLALLVYGAHDARDAEAWLDVLFYLSKETYAYKVWTAWRDDILALVPNATLPRYAIDSYYLAGNILRELEHDDRWLQIVLHTDRVRDSVKRILDQGVDAYVTACVQRSEQAVRSEIEYKEDGSPLPMNIESMDPVAAVDVFQFDRRAIADVRYGDGRKGLYIPETWANMTETLASDPLHKIGDDAWRVARDRAVQQARIRLAGVHPSSLPEEVGIQEYLAARNVSRVFLRRLAELPPEPADVKEPHYVLSQLLFKAGLPLGRLKDQLQRERIDKAHRSVAALSFIHFLLTHRGGEYKQDETVLLNQFPTEESFGERLTLDRLYAQLIPLVQSNPDVYAVDVANAAIEWLRATTNANELNAKLSAIDSKSANVDQENVNIVGPRIPEGALDRRVLRERPTDEGVQTDDARRLIHELLRYPGDGYGTHDLYRVVLSVEGKEAHERQLFGQPGLEFVYGAVMLHLERLESPEQRDVALKATVRAFYRWLSTYTNHARELNEILSTVEIGEAVFQANVLEASAAKGLGSHIPSGTLEGLVDREYVLRDSGMSNEASTLVHDLLENKDNELAPQELEPYATLEPLFGFLLRYLRDSPDAETRLNRLNRLVQTFYSWLDRFEVVGG